MLLCICFASVLNKLNSISQLVQVKRLDAKMLNNQNLDLAIDFVTLPSNNKQNGSTCHAKKIQPRITQTQNT